MFDVHMVHRYDVYDLEWSPFRGHGYKHRGLQGPRHTQNLRQTDRETSRIQVRFFTNRLSMSLDSEGSTLVAHCGREVS